jgi:DNA adenine methylase
MPFTDLIDRYDRPGTWFYVDPPYWGCENDYGKGLFRRADFEVLADRLARIKGRFILSINDVPAIRKVFGRFELREVQTRYSVGDVDRKAGVKELLFSNAPLVERGR